MAHHKNENYLAVLMLFSQLHRAQVFPSDGGVLGNIAYAYFIHGAATKDDSILSTAHYLFTRSIISSQLAKVDYAVFLMYMSKHRDAINILNEIIKVDFPDSNYMSYRESEWITLPTNLISSFPESYIEVVNTKKLIIIRDIKSFAYYLKIMCLLYLSSGCEDELRMTRSEFQKYISSSIAQNNLSKWLFDSSSEDFALHQAIETSDHHDEVTVHSPSYSTEHENGDQKITGLFEKLSIAPGSTLFSDISLNLLNVQFNGEIVIFERHSTQGDGSCGFYALPIANDRQGARQLLLDNIDNEHIRRMVGTEIREALLARDLPEVLLNNHFYRQWLAEHEVLIERADIEAHDQRLTEYTVTAEAYRDFINHDTGGEGRLGFNAFATETSVLDALALISNLRIHIFHDDGLFVSRGPENGTPTYLYHYYGQNTHFELMSIVDKSTAIPAPH